MTGVVKGLVSMIGVVIVNGLVSMTVVVIVNGLVSFNVVVIVNGLVSSTGVVITSGIEILRNRRSLLLVAGMKTPNDHVEPTIVEHLKK